MSRLARWCARRRLAVLSTWIIVVVGLGGAALSAGAAFTNSTTMPDSESATAYSLLDTVGAGESTAEGTGTIAWQTSGESIDSSSVETKVDQVLARIDAMPGVTAVVSPYTTAGAGQLDPDHNVAFATVTMKPSADVDAVEAAAKSLDDSGLEVMTGGRAFTAIPHASGLTEVIGILGALLVLLLMFRSMWAAVLPIITGVAGVVTSLFLVMLGSHVVDLADSTPTMGALIGLGVGIDYALFIVNRHRKGLLRGDSVEDSIARAIDTSGRAVMFAGGTVVIALLGMFVVHIDILTGMARAAALTVTLTVLAALTLLPALLSLLGLRVLSRRQRRELSQRPADAGITVTAIEPERGTLVSRWSALVENRPRSVVAVVLGLMVVLAIPAFGIRLGSADASSDPASSDSHEFYSMMSTSFGDGFDAPLVLVAETKTAESRAAFDDLVAQVTSVDDVAAVSAAPTKAGQTVSVATVTPSSSAQAKATADLVNSLRDTAIPAAEKGTDLQVYVGGITASNIDNAQATTSKLPLYLALIAVLGFVLLAIAFRSILVPLIGAVGNLLTLAVGLGAIVTVFQHGWGSGLLGVGTAAPIESLVPVLIIGIMFGLSMDYQVFLVSRMHEEWTDSRDNARAVRVGLQETSRVIATAAVIMLCVFSSFGFGGQRIIAEIGIGLAVAVLVDAFLLRMTMIPALMHLVGARNWAYPRWAERITPHVSVEGAHKTADDDASDDEDAVADDIPALTRI